MKWAGQNIQTVQLTNKRKHTFGSVNYLTRLKIFKRM